MLAKEIFAVAVQLFDGRDRKVGQAAKY